MRAGAEGGGQVPGSQMILLIRLTLLFLSFTSFMSFPRSQHSFLPPFISWAVEITCPLARAHHQSHDSLRVASVTAAALIESRGRVRLYFCLDTAACTWKMTFELKVYFFNLFKSIIFVCPPPRACALCPSLRLSPSISDHISHALQGWSGVLLTLPPSLVFLTFSQSI